MGFKEARNKACLTLSEAGERIGVTDAAICQWEKGKTMPKAALLPKIAKVYGCNIEDLYEKRGEV